MSPVEALREIGFLLERSRADTFRVKAYRGAADALAAMSEAAIADHQRNHTWAQVTGVGPKTALVITQALAGSGARLSCRSCATRRSRSSPAGWGCAPPYAATCTCTPPGPTAVARWRR